jgi:DNA-binding NarL/FixJ family response regulator
MDNLQILLMLSISGISATMVCSVICIALVIKARAETSRTVALAIQLESEIQTLQQTLSTTSQKAADYGRRLAWLETRNRRNAPTPEPIVGSTITTPTQEKTSMTERRHRVLTLAKRGLDARTIASTLGLHHGEVELIIGLSSVS